ncbi:MAG: hypothetical protein COA45_00325 [Zetaproteobacteria bacterium]|nr:MAG: hypothetical protein COA45_00325 [Zetaproteobacteria bacterium]
MILTCPNCNGQFKIDDDLIGDKGRKVKCSSCSEIWFQESESIEPENDVALGDFEEDAVLGDIEEDVVLGDIEEEEGEDGFYEVDLVDAEEPEHEEQPLPESIHREISLKHIKRAVESHGVGSKSQLLGYGIAATVFVLILSFLLSNSTSMMNNRPSMQAFYNLFGIYMEIPGEGLVFDQLAVEDNGETITVSGRIINLESVSVSVPVIEASLLDPSGVPITQWYIQPPMDILEAEASLSFHSIYYKSKSHETADVGNEREVDHEDEHGEDVHNQDVLHLQIRFALLSRIDVGDGESNSVHQQDAQNHQSDHAESSKSHQSVSSEEHQAPSHGNH